MRKIEQIITWKTSDGKLFDCYDNAHIHQEILDGIKKGCNNCFNSGKVLVDKTLQKPKNFLGRNYFILEDCSKCSGLGYIL